MVHLKSNNLVKKLINHDGNELNKDFERVLKKFELIPALVF